jgi:hypothetical protein
MSEMNPDGGAFEIALKSAAGRIATSTPPGPLTPPFDPAWKRWNMRSHAVSFIGSAGVSALLVSKSK